MMIFVTTNESAATGAPHRSDPSNSGFPTVRNFVQSLHSAGLRVDLDQCTGQW